VYWEWEFVFCKTHHPGLPYVLDRKTLWYALRVGPSPSKYRMGIAEFARAPRS